MTYSFEQLIKRYLFDKAFQLHARSTSIFNEKCLFKASALIIKYQFPVHYLIFKPRYIDSIIFPAAANVFIILFRLGLLSSICYIYDRLLTLNMLYRKFIPSVGLKPFVETFYVWECAFNLLTPLIVESPPNGYASMVFNYGNRYSVVNDKYHNQIVPAAFLAGQSTKSYRLHLNGSVGMIGVVFKPAAVNTIFGFPMFEFSDERIDLTSILGNDITVLHDQILAADTAEKRVNILENYLSKKVLQCKRSYDRNDFIANLILEKHGILPIQDLMKELYVCPRQFQRQFLNKVGVSAKYYARISRMSNLCAMMARSNWNVQDWHHIIYLHGYYDQSHFIKEFTEFMGKAPSSYLRSNLELGNYLKS